MSDTDRRIFARVKQLRESRRWSVVELAAEMTAKGFATHPTALYNLFQRPASRVPVDYLIAFADVFDIPIDQLITTDSLCQTCLGSPPQGFICGSCHKGES